MTRARLGALLLLAVLSPILASAAWAQVEEDTVPRTILVEVDGLSFDEALGIPELAALARAGGAGLLVNPDDLYADPAFRRRGLEQIELVRLDRTSPTFGADLREAVEAEPADSVLVVVTSKTPPGGVGNDELAPIVMAVGASAELFPAAGPQGSLTSESTRRDGVVASADVGATFLTALPGPSSDLGTPIEIIEGPPPFELHERYLAQRRMYIPIGGAAAAYVIGFGLVAVAFLAAGPRVGVRWRRVAGWISLSVAMLAVGLLAAGHLPELTYAAVVPFIALVTVFGTLAFAPLERRDVLLVPAGIGLAVLGCFVVEAALGWSAMLTPFVGGSQLDGGRFYGMPNVCIGLLVGACFWVAQRLRTAAGVVLLVGAALFAGLPSLGANLGGAATLFAGAGLWIAVHERERLGLWKGLAVFLGITLLGTALILLVHAVSPIETHVTRFEEEVSGIGGIIEKFADRLKVGFDLIARNPLALIPVLGLPVAILAALRPPSALRPSLERSPAWRDAILATLLTGVVAYVLNDSGPAAAGFAFGLGLGGLMGVSLLLGAGKMVDR